MYNPELKERFLSEATESEHTRKVYRDIFRLTEKFESEAGSDVCEMDAVTGKPLADSLVNIAGESVNKRLTLVKQYVRWCVRNEIPGASLAFVDVVPMPPYEKIRAKMISGPRMMRDYLDSVFDRPEKRTVHNVYRCYLWLGFIGVSEDMADKITAADVDLAERTVRSGGETFDIPDEAMPEFRNCTELTGFNREYETVVTMRPRGSGSAILRGFSDTVNVKTLRVKTSKIRKDVQDKGITEKAVTYSYAGLSGIFYRAFRQEMAGLPVDFSRDVKRLEGESDRRDPDIKGVAWRRSKLMRELNEDYKRWKLVFTA